MSTSAATADWELLEDKYYRKILLYADLFPDLDLNDYILAGAPHSGAIALWRDPTAISTFRNTATTTKKSIQIFSSAGRLIRTIPADNQTVKALGWSEDEQLLVITEDGTVRCYYDLQGDFTQFSLGHGAEEVGVREARFWHGGFVALLGNNRLVAVSRYDEPRPRLLADAGTLIEDGIHAWALIPPAYTLSRHVEVLLSTASTIVVVDATEAQDQVLQNGPFAHIAVSPNGKYVALYTAQGTLWVIKADFQEKLSEYDSGMTEVPRQVEWCGNDSVVIAWDEEVHMIGPRGAALRYYYDSRVHLIPDIDGTRIFTTEKCELLQKVPDVTEEIFRIGATSPASILLDAVDQLERGSPKADDNIQLIRAQLPEAVDACTKAAGMEFSVHWQKMLLRAASFGKSVCEGYASDGFVEMTETLRVLNAVRFFEVGLPLTYEQYLRLTPEKLMHRLTSRQQHLLALRISTHLRLPTDRIYIHWACLKLRLSTDDEPTITRLIVQKLLPHPSISFESIARTAYTEGRPTLALQLLSHEPQPSRQVPLLLTMSHPALALDRALESGDTELVHYVLLHLRQTHARHEFFRLITPRPLAAALVEASADPDLLRDFYYQDDRRAASAHAIFAEAITTAPPDTQKLTVAQSLLHEDKTQLFAATALADYQRLLTLQLGYAREFAEPEHVWLLPLHQTLRRLFELDSSSAHAQKLKTSFKIPEATYTWIRLRALIGKRDWRAVEDAIDSGKPGGVRWESWVEELLGVGAKKVAGRAVERCNVPARKELWVRCGEWEKAAEECRKRGEAEWARKNVLAKCPEEVRGRVQAVLERKK